MGKLPYNFFNIPDRVFENNRLPPYAKLILAYLIRRENVLRCQWGKWFASTYTAIASPLGITEQAVRKKYVPLLAKEGLVETRTEQGFDKKERVPKRTCYYRILWDNILDK